MLIYFFEYYKDTTWESIASGIVDQSYLVVSLPYGQRYAFRVYASNAVGISPASNVSNNVLYASSILSPANIRATKSAVSANSTRVQFLWNAPKVQTNATWPIWYTVELNEGSIWNTVATYLSATEYNATLSTGNTYQLRVTSHDSLSSSEPAVFTFLAAGLFKLI